jgi:hypothetical protein
MNRRARTLQHRLQPGLGGIPALIACTGSGLRKALSVRFPAWSPKFPRDSRCRPFQ